MDPASKLHVRSLPLNPAVLPLGCILRRPHEHLNATIEDELLVLDPASGHFHVLSHTAALIHSAVGGWSTTVDVANLLAAQVGAPADEFIDEVAAAVATMVDEGLLVADDPSLDTAGLPRLKPVVTPQPDGRNRHVSAGAAIDSGPLRAGAATLRVLSDIPDVGCQLVEPLSLLPTAQDGDMAVITVTDPGDSGPFEIHLDGITVAATPSVDGAAEAVLSTCNKVATMQPRNAVRVHGGVVSIDDKAVVICGESGAGKSTLTAGLVQHGWQYLTDEVAVIDHATFTVTPYPKWIDLSGASLDLLGIDKEVAIGPTGRKHHIPPATLGTVGGPAQVSAVVMLTGDAPEIAPDRPCTRDAVHAMLANVFATTWDHHEGLHALVALCNHADVVHLPRMELTKMIDQVTMLIRSARSRT